MTESDKNFLTAATTNLYIESIRRGHNRVLLAPQDIPILSELISIIVNPIQLNIIPADSLRTRALTEEEKERVMAVVEEKVAAE